MNRHSEEERNYSGTQESPNAQFVLNQETNIINYTPFNLIIELSDNSASSNRPMQ